ncbi:MAG: hypothetical protein KGY74_08100, partial [Candidatus Cloacimonetes bacterium]|nr:hypothetical protein [Candidatus Cloacimonadota bacterium]
MKKRNLLIIMIFCFVFLTTGNLFAYSGGSGTAGDPYQIATTDDLIELSNNSGYGGVGDKHFIQTENITFNADETLVDWDGDGTADWDAEDQKGFFPIGTDWPYFTGSYDGQNYTIENLYINRDTEYHIGLFARIDGGTIENLGVINVENTGYRKVGSLVGISTSSSVISNCYSTGSVTGEIRVGGLAGYNHSNSIISSSYSNCSVEGYQEAGGFVGMNYESQISNSYSTGDVTRSSGETDTKFGGFCGHNSNYDDVSAIEYCYSTGSVFYENVTDPTNKGFVGYEDFSTTNTYTANFFDSEASNQNTDALGAGAPKTTTEMKTACTFIGSGWDFCPSGSNSGGIWTIDESASSPDNDGYPALAWQGFTNTYDPCTTAPTVTNASGASGINATSATLNGEVTDTGGENPTVTIYWDETDGGTTPGNWDQNINKGTQAGTFSSAISDLSPITTYYYRCYAENSAGSDWANSTEQFTTPSHFTGSGTTSNPYEIQNLDDLRALSEHTIYWDKHFVQTADIDASATSTWNDDGSDGYYGFSPIGNSSTKFTGSYDGSYSGQNHTIENLFINRPSTDYVGMFGYTSGSANIQNVQLEDVDIVGDGDVGGLVGENYGGTIGNSTSSGSVEGSSDNVGGLVGKNDGGTIGNSASSCSVNGDGDVGGLVGDNDNSTIVNSTSSGSVEGSGTNIGGLVGKNNEGTSTIGNSASSCSVNGADDDVGGLVGDNEGTISNSASSGSVNGSTDVGGLVGDNVGTIGNSTSSGSVDGSSYVGGLVGENDGGTIEYSYSSGSVNGSSNVGGLVGYNKNSGTVTNSFWDTETSNQTSSDGGTGLSTIEMGFASTFNNAGWDEAIWTLADGESAAGYEYHYPYLTGVTASGDEPAVNTLYNGGMGTETNAYTITDWKQLYNIRYTADDGKYYQLANSLNSTSDHYHDYVKDDGGNLVDDGKGWLPIQDYSAGGEFNGTFDGNDQTITGLEISRTSTDDIGLFSLASSATLKNLTLEATIEGRENTGALVGRANPATHIESIVTTAQTTVTGDFYIGGLIGFIVQSPGTITDCSTDGTVEGSASVGGIAGGAFGSTIENSSSSAAVSAITITSEMYSTLGGLVGYSQNSTITNCHATGNVTVATGISAPAVGGLIGGLKKEGDNTSLVENCSATGTVTAVASDYVGGLIGHSIASTIRQSKASGAVSGSEDIGGLVGYMNGNEISTTLKNSYALGDVTGDYNVGGLVGKLIDETIINSYCSNIVTLNGSNEGGLVGDTTGTNTITDSYFDKTVNSGMPDENSYGKTTTEMQQIGTYTLTSTSGLTSAWDFIDNPNDDSADDNYWGINPAENSGYPFLSWEGYTQNSRPTVLTDAATNVGTHTATGNGEITYIGTGGTNEYGVCWNTSQDPTIADNRTNEGSTSTIGTFSSDMSGLAAGETYYIRAYAKNTAGTTYGENVSITTNYYPQFVYDGTTYDDGDSIEVDTDEDTDLVFDLQVTDADNSQTFTWNSQDVTHGTVSIEDPNKSTEETKQITFDPEKDYYGYAEFTISVSDNISKATSYLKFKVTVNPINDPPICVINPELSGDPYVNQVLSTTNGTWSDSLDNPNPGSFTYTYQWQQSNDGTTFSDIGGATASTFTIPDTYYNQYVVCQVTATDDGYGTPATQSTTAPSDTVQILNTAPQFVYDATTYEDGDSIAVDTDEDTDLVFDLQAYDADDSQTFTWNAINVTHATVFIDDPTKAPSTQTKQITFTPDKDYYGNAEFTISVSDNISKATSYLKFKVTVNPINDPPICVINPELSGDPYVNQVLSTTNGTWSDSLDNPN